MTFELKNVDWNWEHPVGTNKFLRVVCLEGSDGFSSETVFRRDVWKRKRLYLSARNEEVVC